MSLTVNSVSSTHLKVATVCPALRENLWHIDPAADVAGGITPDGTFTLPNAAAMAFLQMRSYCTGHNSVSEIAAKAGMSIGDVEVILDGLRRTGILLDPSRQCDLSHDDSKERLKRICRLWGDELTQSFIGNQFSAGRLSKTILLGWLLEMYHYIADFPQMITHAADRASGRLREVLSEYARQERGHEEFVVQTLERVGFKREEVESSTPLVSTRAIGFVVRDIVEQEPSAMLMLASMLEAQEFSEPNIQKFAASLEQHYAISASAFQPYFEHQAVDVALGHAQLFEDYFEEVEVDCGQLDDLVNKLHDVKHAFDLQELEIKSYYGDLQGRYFPRQPMTYAQI